jgi:predicted nucleic acid-binding protein
MILVVADTSPIHYLVQICAIDVLARLFDQVIIPRAVLQELLSHSTPSEVRQWAANLPMWASVQSAGNIQPLSLGGGETEAIALAKELRAFAILLDDNEARRIAHQQGLAVTGTIGILEHAAALNLLDLPDAIGKLKRTTFYASEALLQKALERDAERRHRKG